MLSVTSTSPTLLDTAAAAAQPTAAPAVAIVEPSAAAPLSTTVYGETAELEAEGRAALARFAAEGLDLPVIDLRVYAGTEPCRSPDGTERSGVTTIFTDGYEVRSCGTTVTLMHELAHVWDHYVLDDTTRQALLDLRGLDSWSHATWSKAGGEHLASVVAWGLTGIRPKMVVPVDDASLAAAYELVTGEVAPSLTERGLVFVDGHVRRDQAAPATALNAAADPSRSQRLAGSIIR